MTVDPTKESVAQADKLIASLEAVSQGVDALKAERDDLLAALRDCHEGMSVELNAPFNQWVSRGPGGKYRDALRQAGAAIAAAEARR